MAFSTDYDSSNMHLMFPDQAEHFSLPGNPEGDHRTTFELTGIGMGFVNCCRISTEIRLQASFDSAPLGQNGDGTSNLARLEGQTGRSE